MSSYQRIGIPGFTTGKVCLPRFSVVLVTITYCEVDDLNCLALFIVQPVLLQQSSCNVVFALQMPKITTKSLNMSCEDAHGPWDM